MIYTYCTKTQNNFQFKFIKNDFTDIHKVSFYVEINSISALTYTAKIAADLVKNMAVGNS